MVPIEIRTGDISIPFDQCFSILTSSEVNKVKNIKNKYLALQRANAYYHLKSVFGQIFKVDLKNLQLDHHKTGRPFFHGHNIDLAISHSENSIMVGMASPPFQLGLDVELIDRNLDFHSFRSFFLCKQEETFFHQLCLFRHYNPAQGLAIFWSIKESFFKCLDLGLLFKELAILNIDHEGAVKISLSAFLEDIMKERGLTLKSVQIKVEKKYVFSATIMERIQ